MATVEDWNKLYASMSREIKDMDADEYEEVVLEQLLDLCDENPQAALAIFEHPDNQGGWMLGDVAGKLQAMT